MTTQIRVDLLQSCMISRCRVHGSHPDLDHFLAVNPNVVLSNEPIHFILGPGVDRPDLRDIFVGVPCELSFESFTKVYDHIARGNRSMAIHVQTGRLFWTRIQ